MGTVQNKKKARVPSGNRSAMIKRLKRKRMISMLTTLAVLAVVLVVVIVGGIFLYRNIALTKIDLRDYTELSYSGYNSKGMLYAQIKDDGSYKEFFGSVTVDITPNGELSNGDEVQLTYHYDAGVADRLKLWVVGTEKTVNMHGLPEANVISYDHLFQDVDVSWEGISPKVVVTVENHSTEEFLKNVEYSIVEPKEFYAKDDTITVKASFDANNAEINGYVIEGADQSYQKDYTITQVDEYITDASDLTKDQIAEMERYARSLFTDANEFGLRIFCEAHLIPVYENGKSTFRWTSPNLISVYFNVLSDHDYLGERGSHVNDVKFVYDAAITQADGVTSKAEAVVRFDDLIKKADGTIDLKLDSGRIVSASGSDRNIKNMVGNVGEEEYDSIKLEY